MTAAMPRHTSTPDGRTGKPLCVDLDGTLVNSDLLYESLLALLRQQSWRIFFLPFWLFRGKAYLKQQIAMRVELDPALLPYNQAMLAKLLQLHGQRPILLCSGSDQRLVRPVAAHVGLFDETLASDGTINLTGPRKAHLLNDRFGPDGYDYAGNHRDDLAVWRHASQAWVVNAGPGLLRAARKICPRVLHLPRRHTLHMQLLKALRPHQWLKNLLIFTPLLAAQRFQDESAWLATLLAFAAFCLCASGLYLLNDLLDLNADRHHPRKRQRPFAAGRLPLSAGMLAAPPSSRLRYFAGNETARIIHPHPAVLCMLHAALQLGYQAPGAPRRAHAGRAVYPADHRGTAVFLVPGLFHVSLP